MKITSVETLPCNLRWGVSQRIYIFLEAIITRRYFPVESIDIVRISKNEEKLIYVNNNVNIYDIVRMKDKVD